MGAGNDPKMIHDLGKGDLIKATRMLTFSAQIELFYAILRDTGLVPERYTFPGTASDHCAYQWCLRDCPDQEWDAFLLLDQKEGTYPCWNSFTSAKNMTNW